MERWIQTCRAELLDRTLIWHQSHLLHTLREYEAFYNEHRPHRALAQAAHYPHPSPNKPNSPIWKSADETDSAEPSTSTSTPPELRG